MDNSDKIRKWLAGELSDSERREFERSDEYANISKILNSVEHFAAPEYDVEEAYNRLSARTVRKTNVIHLYSKLSPVFKVAAVFIFALVTGYFTYNQLRDSGGDTEWIADQSELYLPDSSFVILNAESRIRISESGWKNERKVELEGEAFFKVKKGSQFTVRTDQGSVSVLGTEFSVKDREDYFDVICYSGLVNVLTAQGSSVLSANTAFRVFEDKVENYSLVNKSEPDWLHGESSFKSIPVKFVLDELERQYQVSVKIRNVDENRLFSGSFSNQDLEIALESVTLPLDLNYKINGNKTVITLEGK